MPTRTTVVSRIGTLTGTILLLTTAVLALQGVSDTPEGVIRLMFKAMFANDAAGFERLTIPDPRRHLLTKGGQVNEKALKELEEDPSSLQIKVEREFRYRGKPVQPDSKGDYPVGTTVLYMVAHGGSPMMVSLTRLAEGWRIDLRWWLAMVEMAAGQERPRSNPEYAARALAGTLLKLDRKAALRFAMPGSNLDVLFAGAPRYREPSGHLDALVAEMPIIEIGPTEFFEMPSGRIVEGVKRVGGRVDRKVLVGLMGVVEIPFIVNRVGTEWRVEAEPYFLLLNR